MGKNRRQPAGQSQPSTNREHLIETEVTGSGRLPLIRSLSVVLILFCAISSLKIRFSTQGSYNPADDTAYYWSESALQYRNARIIGAGKDVPAIDTAAEYPEGITTDRELTLTMERVTGNLYRLVKRFYPVPFGTFVIYSYSVFSSLSVLVFFFAACIVSKSPLPALLMTAAYGFDPGSWSRFIRSYEYEGFALPWLFLAFACCCASIQHQAGSRRHSWAHAVCAGTATALGLISWHFSRFYVLVLILGLVLVYFVNPRAADARTRIANLMTVILVFCLAAGALFPVLRLNGFLWSPLMIIGCSLVFAHRMSEGRAQLTAFHTIVLYLATAATLGFSSAMFLSSDASAYGHVYAVYVAKLVHLFQKPPNPAALPMEARLLWVSPFDSPTLGYMAYTMLPLGLPALLPVFSAIRDRAQGAGDLQNDASFEPQHLLLLFMTLATTFLFILVERLAGLCLFFLALFALHSTIKHLRSRAGIAAALSILALGELSWAALGRGQTQTLSSITERLISRPEFVLLEQHNIDDTLRWIRTHAKPEDKFLADIGFSPQILAYAGRPILLQPKFEAAKTREKYVEFLKALYGSADALFNFCTKYGSDYFVYQSAMIIDDSSEGDRYVADALTLAPTTAAYRLHFLPASLKHFSLVYQNSDFRIYRVVRSSQESTVHEFGFKPFDSAVYDSSEFPLDKNLRELRQGDSNPLLDKLRRRRSFLRQAQTQRNRGDYGAAADLFNKVLILFPKDDDSWLQLGQMAMTRKDYVSAGADLKKAVESNPNSMVALQLLANLYMRSGKLETALPLLERIVVLNPLDADSYNDLGAIYLRKKELQKSMAYFSEAFRINPADPEIAKNYRIVTGLVEAHHSRP